jgi:hypothetical protein
MRAFIISAAYSGFSVNNSLAWRAHARRARKRPPAFLPAAQVGFSSPGKLVSAAHCAAEAMVKSRKLFAIFGVGDGRQIMFQRFAQQFEIFTRKNGA